MRIWVNLTQIEMWSVHICSGFESSIMFGFVKHNRRLSISVGWLCLWDQLLLLSACRCLHCVHSHAVIEVAFPIVSAVFAGACGRHPTPPLMSAVLLPGYKQLPLLFWIPTLQWFIRKKILKMEQLSPVSAQSALLFKLLQVIVYDLTITRECTNYSSRKHINCSVMWERWNPNRSPSITATAVTHAENEFV